MRDLLTFQTFITPTLLIIIYYAGAIFIPLASWYFAKWIQSSYFSDIAENIKEKLQNKIPFKQRFTIYVVFILCFLCMEILWRVMFEFFIAYFDMHDALMKMLSH